MKEILLFCNVERQGQMLRKAWKMAEMPEEISSGVHLFDSASALTPEMRRAVSDAAAVFVFWQGSIYATHMTEALRKVREKTGAPFAFLCSASEEGAYHQGTPCGSISSTGASKITAACGGTSPTSFWARR